MKKFNVLALAGTRFCSMAALILPLYCLWTPSASAADWKLVSKNTYIVFQAGAMPSVKDVKVNGKRYPARVSACGGMFELVEFCTYADFSRDLDQEEREKKLAESRKIAEQDMATAIANGTATCGDSHSSSGGKLHDVIEVCDNEIRFVDINPTNPKSRYQAQLVRVCEKFDVGCLSPSTFNPLERHETVTARKIVADTVQKNGSVVFDEKDMTTTASVGSAQ